MCSHPFAALSARISRASAPQAISSTRPRPSGTRPASLSASSEGASARADTDIVLAGHLGLRRLHGDGRVAAVGVGPDGPPELLVQRRAAHEHDVIVADALLLQGVD